MAVGTIYNYFQNKEEIITGIFGGENIKKRNAFYKIIAQMELEPLDKIKSVVEMHFTGLDHHRIIQGYYSGKDFYLRAISAGNAPDDGLRNFIAGVLENGIAEKKIIECDTEIVASIICGALETVIADILNNKIADIKDAVEEIMATIRTGIASA